MYLIPTSLVSDPDLWPKSLWIRQEDTGRDPESSKGETEEECIGFLQRQ